MFVLRAVFWIPVVALLAPSDPDFGPRGEISGDVLHTMETQAFEALVRVKAEIAAQKRAGAAPDTNAIALLAEPALRSDLARESGRRPNSPP